MVTETDGIILKQTRLPGERNILVVFTRKYGKISAGSSIRMNGKSRSSLALRVFTHGRYALYHGREIFNINTAETIQSFFSLAEDIEKYLTASYALEFTERVLPENQPEEAAFDALLHFLRILSERKSGNRSLLLVYQWKLLQFNGLMPILDHCARCGRPAENQGQTAFSIVDGGVLCHHCLASEPVNTALIYKVDPDIIKILRYIFNNDMHTFQKLALKDPVRISTEEILRKYVSCHLDIHHLKSESCLPV